MTTSKGIWYPKYFSTSIDTRFSPASQNSIPTLPHAGIKHSETAPDSGGASATPYSGVHLMCLGGGVRGILQNL